MNLFKRKNQGPEWLAKVPFEGDRDVIKQMLKSGANLSEGREMIFCVYAYEDSAKSLVKEVKLQGWLCEIRDCDDPNADEQALKFIEIKKNDYAVTLETFTKDKELLTSICDKYDAEYDGWCASI